MCGEKDVEVRCVLGKLEETIIIDSMEETHAQFSKTPSSCSNVGRICEQTISKHVDFPTKNIYFKDPWYNNN